MTPDVVRWFKDVRARDVAQVGGKNASLGDVHHAVGRGRSSTQMVLLACFGAGSSFAGAASGKFESWKLEEPSSCTVIDPVSTNLKIESAVLACEEAGNAKVLQLQIYLSTEGPLSPKGVESRLLKGDPRAEIAMDGRVFPVGIFFADDYAVPADESEEMFPRLSEGLLDAMATAQIMVLHFDLVAERPGQPAAVDSEAVIALQAGAGGSAVSAMRRCTGPGNPSAAAVHAKH